MSKILLRDRAEPVKPEPLKWTQTLESIPAEWDRKAYNDMILDVSGIDPETMRMIREKWRNQ
jgi:hypothetical protein